MIDFEEKDIMMTKLIESLQNGYDSFGKLIIRTRQGDELCVLLYEFYTYMVSTNDLENLKGYFELIPSDIAPTDKDKAGFCQFVFDVQSGLITNRWRKYINTYDVAEDIIFQDSKDVSEELNRKNSKKGKPDYEMFDSKNFELYSNQPNVEKDGTFFQLTPLLNYVIPAWIRQNYPECKLAVRLDPTKVDENLMPFLLVEQVRFDPFKINPNNIILTDGINNDGTLCHEEKEFSIEKYHEYKEHVKWGIHCLEWKAFQKEKGGYKEFMVEELRYVEDMLVGHVLHFDVSEFNDDDLNSNVLFHLDLAYQIYEGPKIDERLNQHLSKGLVKTKKRVHVLRVENLPITAFPVIARCFFMSRLLTTQYLESLIK